MFTIASSLQGTRVERALLYVEKEMEKLEISIAPEFYLSHETGVVDGTSSVAIATKELHSSPRRLRKLIAHELGHVLFYHYNVVNNKEVREVFGDLDAEYPDGLLFPFNPLSRSYVYYLRPFYGQKHPEEDFAETFAAFLEYGEDALWMYWWLDDAGVKKLTEMMRLIALLQAFTKIGVVPNCVYEREDPITLSSSSS